MKQIKLPAFSFFILPVLFIGFISTLGSCLTTPKTEKAWTLPDTSFHLYLLMGQSNMSGRGSVETPDTTTHPRVLMLDKDGEWVTAHEPLHFDKPTLAGTGPGFSFGKQMAEAQPGIQIGLIPCAKGGSSLDHWISKRYHKQTDSYPYDEAIERARTGMKRGILKGMIWHQGEADSGSGEQVISYADRFQAFLDSLEKDLGIGQLPVVVGELGYFFYAVKPLARDLNAILADITRENECLGLVPADGLRDRGDQVHFDAESARELGRRYAREMLSIQTSCPGPSLRQKSRAK